MTDSGRFKDYQTLAGPSVERYGERYLVRGGASETLEGSWDITRVVVQELETAPLRLPR